MSDSDEDRLLLEDESMDEMYELGDALQVSVDTNASLSPVKRTRPGTHTRRERNDSDDSHGSDDSIDRDSDDSDNSDDSAASGSVEMPVKMAAVAFHDLDVDHDADSVDSDEPPEIPGSPLASAHQAGGPSASGRVNSLSGMSQQAASRSSRPDVLRIRHRRQGGSNSSSDDEDEYVVQETEAPRSTEFHVSSSSDSDDHDDGSSDDEANNRDGHRRRSRQQQIRSARTSSRPKTAAKDLALYRDAIPDAFFQQLNGADMVDDDRQQQQHTTTETSCSSTSALADAPRAQQFVMPVPQEVADLFHLVDAYSPERIDIRARLEPFVSEYVPTIGLPFDGIQIARPDGKTDTAIGLQTLREPASSTSHVAELELLLHAHQSQQHAAVRARQTPFVHSIEDAEHRPREIDQWIESVASVQRTKPLASVVYKKPMPTLETLMELWPEELETLVTQEASVATATATVASLDVSLDELVQLVCVLLDIPVYAGSHIESLHVLFRLYHEIESYERDLVQQQQQHESIR